MKRMYIHIFFLLLLSLAARASFARPSSNIEGALAKYYPAAEMHEGLVTAYVPPDISKLRGFVVVLREGIPAERARFFVSWDDYDYRGAVVHLDKGGEVTTRRGRGPYTYLKKGDIMAVAGIEQSRGTIYLKLISPEIYKPAGRQTEKRFSRVTVMLGFKFPKEVIKNDDAGEVIKTIGDWLKPFPSLEEARVYPAFLTNFRSEAVEKPVAARNAKEKARRRTGRTLSTFFERDAVDMGLSAAAVGNW